MAVADQAWVTLATNNQYALAAMVLARSLRRVGTQRQLACMVVPSVSEAMRNQLSQFFDNVTVVDVFDSQDEQNLALIERPDLGVTFSKLHCWRLTQYTKCVFLDADTLVTQNCEELFERPEFAAAPDIGWPDRFNSGVFVYVPSLDSHKQLVNFALQHGSYDGGDQGLLNDYFSDWYSQDASHRLPFIYNCVTSIFYTYKAAHKKFGEGVKILHFLGLLKPWHYTFNATTGQVEWRADGGHSGEHLQLWWMIAATDVLPALTQSGLGDLVSHVRDLNIIQSEDPQSRRRAWEAGQADFSGQDSFAMIQQRLDEQLGNF